MVRLSVIPMSHLVESSGGVQPYLGAALKRSEDKNFAKHDFGDIEEGTC